ncbi:hypothetical protein C4J81_14040 [Deltaproteobacteria bacterium Smac51]|nr:hypothetical protein C4J81_14040 [Deltaproteobacteria bacterium Smac51]
MAAAGESFHILGGSGGGGGANNFNSNTSPGEGGSGSSVMPDPSQPLNSSIVNKGGNGINDPSDPRGGEGGDSYVGNGTNLPTGNGHGADGGAADIHGGDGAVVSYVLSGDNYEVLLIGAGSGGQGGYQTSNSGSAPQLGRGGNGGAVSVTAGFSGDTLTVAGEDSWLSIVGGRGGGENKSTAITAADGGTGGEASFDLGAKNLKSDGGLNIQAGFGQMMDGGDASFKTSGNVSAASLHVNGARGGDLTLTGKSGKGGDSYFEAGDVFTNNAGLRVSGGWGGANYSGSTATSTGDGGDGGASTFKAANVKLADGGDLNVVAGKGGDSQTGSVTGIGGKGGSVVFEAESATLDNGEAFFISGVQGLDPDNLSSAGAGGDLNAELETLSYKNSSSLNIAKLDGSLNLKIGTLKIESGSLDIDTKTEYNILGTPSIPDAHTTVAETAIETLVLADGGAFNAINGSAVSVSFGLKNLETYGINNVFNPGGPFAPAAAGGTVTLNLPATLKAGDTVLTAATPIDFSGLTADGFILKTEADFTSLYDQDKVILIDGAANIAFIKADGSTIHSVSSDTILSYNTFNLMVENSDKITGTFNGPERAGEGGKTYVESAVGISSVVTNLSAYISSSLIGNLASGPGRPGIPLAVGGSQPGYGDAGHSTRVIFTLGGYTGESGSGNIDHEGFGVGLGLAKDFERTTVGLYLEAGTGSYDTVNHVPVLGGLKGDGDVDFIGGGLVLRHDFLNNVYLEGSVRGGSIDSEFKIKGFHGGNYDASTSYLGAHLGLGYRFAVPGAETAVADIYGKGFWTGTDSYSVRTRGGDRLSLDSVDSLKTRLGGRLSDTFHDGTVEGYVGAAWEHEWDGKGGGKANGIRLKSDDSAEGASIFGEAGLNIKPVDSAFSFDLGIFAKGGEERVFGGNLGLNFTF